MIAAFRKICLLANILVPMVMVVSVCNDNGETFKVLKNTKEMFNLKLL